MDKHTTKEANHKADAKQADAKLSFRKFIKFDVNTAAITDLATDFSNPEKLTPFFQEYKSGIIVAALWLTLYIRSWLTVAPLPIPSLATLPLVLLGLLSLSLSTSSRTLTGLAYYSYTEITSSLTSLTKKILPTWLPRAIPIIVLFPVSRAITLLFVLAVWAIAATYRDGVASVTEDADQAVRHAVSAAEKASEHVRDAKALEVQAMQLAATAVSDDDETTEATVAAAKKVKTDVEEMVKELEMLEAKLDKVRKLAERAKVAAEEGSLELAKDMVVNVGKLVERVVQGGEKVREKVVREKIWDLSLGDGSD